MFPEVCGATGVWITPVLGNDTRRALGRDTGGRVGCAPTIRIDSRPVGLDAAAYVWTFLAGIFFLGHGILVLRFPKGAYSVYKLLTWRPSQGYVRMMGLVTTAVGIVILLLGTLSLAGIVHLRAGR